MVATPSPSQPTALPSAVKPPLMSPLAANVLVGGLYFVLAKFGLLFATIGPSVSPVWPPSGLSVGAILMFGPRLAPGILAGSFLVNALLPMSPWTALAMGFGNVLEALLAFQWFGRGRCYETSLNRLAEVFRFLALAAILPSAASALGGIASLTVGGQIDWENCGGAIQTWWLGNLIGVLVGAPVLLATRRNAFARWTAARLLEATLMLGGLATSCYLIFVRGWETPYADAPLAFIPFPFLIWAALRFGPAGAAYTNLLVATIATLATAREQGPFSAGSFADNVWLLQTFIAIAVIANLIIAATVAERVEAEAALRQSDQQLRMALSGARMGTWTWEFATGKITWSDGMAELFGMGLESFDGTYNTWLRQIHPEDRDYRQQRIQHALATNHPYQAEYRLVRPDGSTRWMRSIGDVTRDAAGKPLRMAGVAMDITAYRTAEKLNERLGRILDSSRNEIYVFEASTLRFLNVNEGARKNLGYTPEELQQLSPLDITTSLTAERFAQLRAPLLAGTENLVVFESSHRRKDGSEYPVEVRLLLSREEIPPVYVAVLQDITQRKRAEQEQLQFERQLRETQKLESLGVLAGGIAHDFNNLLTGILGNATLVRMAMKTGGGANRYLEQIESTSLRAAELCKQMLAYSGKGRFVLRRINLSALVQDSAAFLQLSVSKKAVLELKLAAELPAVQADATQMQQILMNLVINASDAIGDRAGVITVSTGVMHADAPFLQTTHLAPDLPAGDYVYLEVADDGCGMDAETVKRIFDPFFTTKFTGRGLGLAAVLGIVRGHHGALKVTSTPEQGTTFRLLLPRTEGAAEEFRSATPAANNWRGTGTILVVDDEEPVRMVCAGLVESFGFQTIEAADGREAVDIFAQKPNAIALVLLDLTMPNMDGEEAFRELRRIQPDVRVLLMSGFNEQEVSARFTAPGLGGFLQKPFKPEQLRAKLREILDGAGESSELKA